MGIIGSIADAVTYFNTVLFPKVPTRTEKEILKGLTTAQRIAERNSGRGYIARKLAEQGILTPLLHYGGNYRTAEGLALLREEVLGRGRIEEDHPGYLTKSDIDSNRRKVLEERV